VVMGVSIPATRKKDDANYLPSRQMHRRSVAHLVAAFRAK
jgi:hypothetical protein